MPHRLIELFEKQGVPDPLFATEEDHLYAPVQVHISYRDKDGLRYGSFKSIRWSWLRGRRYTVRVNQPNTLALTMTDTLFDRDAWKIKWDIDPSKPRYPREHVIYQRSLCRRGALYQPKGEREPIWMS